MLNSTNLSDKSYEELLAEAIAQIPLYSKEWTNFNPSDPGITILQNLTAFQMLQQDKINTLSDALIRNLLKLAGFTAHQNRAATLLVQAPAQGGGILPPGYQLWSGTTPFETTESVVLNAWGLAAVYAGQSGSYRDISYLIRPGTPAFAYPFGSKPEAGTALTCILSGIPEIGQPVRLWAESAQEDLRTPFAEGDIPPLAIARWQYYTRDGWQDAEAEDETAGFLCSGCITLHLDHGNPAVLAEMPQSGCALRCLLQSAEYDRVPRLTALSAHLFPMRQQRTRAWCEVFPGRERILTRSPLAQLGNLYVFCREESGGPYRLYQKAPPSGREGRFYRLEETPDGLALIFDPTAFGWGPCPDDDAVRVSCLDDEMIHHRALGTVYGFENQTIALDLVKQVLPDSFLLAVEVPDADGDSAYYFAEPGGTAVDNFCYQLDAENSALLITNPGLGGDCHLYLCDCVETLGALGNVRSGSTLEQRGGYDGTEVLDRYSSPTPGRGGLTYESTEELRMRFSAQLRSVGAAVSTEDYETLVLQTPGLCIHKVRAIADGIKNLVKIVIKPYTEEEFPRLSPFYLRQISAFLESRRMLTTRLELEQPRYVPVSVSATLSIRGSVSAARETIEGELNKALDYVNGPQSFGEWVRFNDLYQLLNRLPFVDSVDALSLYPETRDAVVIDGDVRLDSCSLCCPGSIYLTLQNR